MTAAVPAERDQAATTVFPLLIVALIVVLIAINLVRVLHHVP